MGGKDGAGGGAGKGGGDGSKGAPPPCAPGKSGNPSGHERGNNLPQK